MGRAPVWGPRRGGRAGARVGGGPRGARPRPTGHPGGAVECDESMHLQGVVVIECRITLSVEIEEI